MGVSRGRAIGAAAIPQLAAKAWRARRRLLRGLVFDLLAHVTPAIAIDTAGLRLFVSTTDVAVARYAFASGVQDRTVLARVVAELDRAGLPGLSGGGFIDIGAHIGTATCFALGLHAASHSWAFEPSPENVLLLRQNLMANGFTERATVFPFAVSDSIGTVTLELSRTNSGDHRVRTPRHATQPRDADELDRRALPIPSVPLDQVIESSKIDLRNIRIAWIDTQGHEASVLAGATRLLASEVPIVCEYWPYGLKRADGLERFNALVAAARPMFVDLERPDGRREPTTTLGDLAARHSGRTHTDLLLLPAGITS